MLLRVLIVIPCYNEEASLPALLQELESLQLPPEFYKEVLVVNDCSKDSTADIARSQAVNLLNLPINLGIGGAVQSGFKYAREYNFDFAIQLDGDGQHPPSQIIRLLEAYKIQGADIVIGSRFIENEGFQSTFIRRLGISYFHWLNRIFTGKSIYDSTSGFRLLNKKAIRFAAANYPDDYPEPESLVSFTKAGFRIAETPVRMRARTGGRSSIQNTASLFYTIKVSMGIFFSFIRKTN